MSRPCRYCAAAWGADDVAACRWSHRDEQRVYDLAAAMAAAWHGSNPADEKVGWFLEEADAIVNDFSPAPDRWKIRRLPGTSEFKARFRVNDVTYVCPPGGKGTKAMPVRLATWRQWQKEADGMHAQRTERSR